MPTLHLRHHLPAPTAGARPQPTGLAWDGRHFWLADAGSARVLQLEPDGQTVRDTLLCPGRLSGTAWDGTSLWQAIHVDGEIRRLSPERHDIDETIGLAGHGWLSGLAWDGALLWVVAQQQGALLGVEPATGRVARHLPAPVAAGGLTFHQGTLWLAYPERMTFDPASEAFAWVGPGERYALARIDPVDGQVRDELPLPFLPLGLAWVAETLWLTRPRDASLVVAGLA